MTEWDKMISGQLYDASDPELARMRIACRELLQRFTHVSPVDEAMQQEIARNLLGSMGEGVTIVPPFYCDYGCNISVGSNVFMNFSCTILDPAPVVIGDNVQFGPSVQVYTATHPIMAAERIKGPEMAYPVTIGENSWVGGGAILCPNVTVGRNVVVGAGAVVTRDVPDNVVVAGNPARVIREL